MKKRHQIKSAAGMVILAGGREHEQEEVNQSNGK
jgi:hypothetical protein